VKIPWTYGLTLAVLILGPLSARAQIGGEPGASGRLGFGARGMALGNAMTAVADGDIVGYYNPALLPWAEYRSGAASVGILSLDRTLNFLSYTQALPPQAGISVGIINAGVSAIDGRDADGVPTGELKTSENRVFIAFGVKMTSGLTFGISLKLLHYHLYTDMTSMTAGIDLGVYYPLTEDLSLGATIRDINSKYKWDSSTLLGQSGTTSNDPFPQLYTIGAAYRILTAHLSADLEFSNQSSVYLRSGIELPIIPELTLRAGIDRIDLKEKGNGVRPAFGFSTGTNLGNWSPRVQYAYVIEPFAPVGFHMITLSARF
jgi:hypothetical protein